MQIPILIEPVTGGRFRARSGEPFVLSVDGDTAQEALGSLEKQLNERLRAGAQVAIMKLPNGVMTPGPQLALTADDAYKTDWVFKEMQDAIAENRRLEESAEP